MDEEKKEILLFTIFTAEAKGLSLSETADHVVKNMRSRYGGYWSAVGAHKDSFHSIFYHSYYKAASGMKAVFSYYRSYHWNVYEHACMDGTYSLSNLNNSIPEKSPQMEPEEDDQLTTLYSNPTVEFGSRTEMNEKMKNNLLYSVFIAERKGSLPVSDRLKLVANKMESFYGGSWSVHMSSNRSIVGTQTFERGYFAEFNFKRYTWIIYKNKCD